MADLRALVIPTTGAGAGNYAHLLDGDQLQVGAGIKGTSGTNVLVISDASGSGTIRVPAAQTLEVTNIDVGGPIYIGQNGATAVQVGQAGITIDVGTPSDATATINLNGNVLTRGTETVVGTSEFQEDATFQGDVTFGVQSTTETDTVTFASHTRITSNMIFGLANRRIAMEDGALDTTAYQFTVSGGDGGAYDSVAPGDGGGLGIYGGSGGAYPAGTGGDGGSIVITGGTGGTGSTQGDGGDVEIKPGAGTNYGSVIVGHATPSEAYLLFLSSNDVSPTQADGPGFRISSSGNMQFCNAGGTWTSFAAGDTLPTGTNDGDRLEYASGSPGSWQVVQDIHMASTGDRTIDVRSAATARSLTIAAGTTTTADAAGANLYLIGGAALGTGIGGGVSVSGAQNGTGGPGGLVAISGGNSTAMDGGDVTVVGGTAAAGAGDGGNLTLAGGGTTGGSRGTVYTYGPWELKSSSSSVYAVVNLQCTNVTNSADGYTTGTRFLDNVGMIWAYKGDGYLITQENADAASVGGPMTLQGGRGTGAGGGALNLYGGNAETTGAGGTVTITGGAGGATSGNGGSVAVNAGTTTTSGAGGNITLTASSAATSGLGGNITGTAGNSAGAGGAGGHVNFDAGQGTGTGDGGYVRIRASKGGAGGNGGDATVQAGDGGTSTGDGGDVFLIPGVGDGDGVAGKAIVGSASMDQSHLLFWTTDGLPDTTDGPGIRYNADTDAMEYNDASVADWTPFAGGGGGFVNAGSDDYQILYWDESGDQEWKPTSELQLPNGDNRGIYIEADSTARTLTVAGSSGLAATNSGGDLALIGGPGKTTGTGGSVRIAGGYTGSGGTMGDVYLDGGYFDGVYGNIYVGSLNTGGTSEVLQFGASGGNQLQIDFTNNGNSRVISSITFDPSSDREVNMAAAAGKGATLSLVGQDSTDNDGGDVQVLAGAASPGAGSGGSVLIRAGEANAGTGGSVTVNAGSGILAGGNVIIGAGDTANVYLEGSTDGIRYDTSTHKLYAIGSGVINLVTTNDTELEFNGVAVPHDANITGANFAKLFDGSDLTGLGLHTHGGTGTGGEFTATANEGAVVGVAYDSTDAGAFNVDIGANLGVDTTPYPIGFAVAASTAGNPVRLVNSGEVTVPGTQFTGGAPTAADVGKPVYASATAGQVTLTAPTGANIYRTRVGYLTSPTTVAINIGDPVFLAA